MIEKITDQNLERYDSRLKEWCDRKFFEKGNYGKYQTTEEAGAVAFYPAPNTPLEGKVKFRFKEMPPASGDKGPENPSTIEGMNTINVYHCNSNMLKYPYQHSSGSSDGVTVTVNDDKSITINGSRSSNFYFRLDNWFPFEKGFTYYQTSKYKNKTNASGNLRFYTDPDYGDAGSGSEPGSAMVMPLDIPSNAKKIIGVKVYANTPASDLVVYPSISCFNYTGPWEAPDRVEKAINLGSTFYGGEIDLVTGLMTVTWWGHVFDGTESPISFTAFTNNGRCVFFQPELQAKNASNQTCTHLPLLVNFNDDSAHFYVNYSGSNTGLVLVTPYLTLSDFKSWLTSQYDAGTPLTVSCELKTPYTVQLTPTQILSLSQTDKYTPRLNTVYTDADSIQISYLKSPIRDEYEKTQAILSLGGNS